MILNHNRIYSGLLLFLAVVSFLSSGLLLFLAGASAGASLRTNLPEWSMPWVAAVNFAYAIAIIVTLCSRQFNSEAGRRLSRVLNWALLPAFLGGTVVGIYGLWNADKDRTSHYST